VIVKTSILKRLHNREKGGYCKICKIARLERKIILRVEKRKERSLNI